MSIYFCYSICACFSLKLEETTAKLQLMSEALVQEKHKTDTLLHQMLPERVADTLRDGHKVPAGKNGILLLFQIPQIPSH